MAHIDKFIAVVFKYGADRLVLEPGRHVLLVAGEAQRAVTAQPVTLEQVQALVQEILPEDATRIVATAAGHEFEYGSPGGPVLVRVEHRSGSMRVEVESEVPPDTAATLALGKGRVGVAVGPTDGGDAPLAPEAAGAAERALAPAAASGDAGRSAAEPGGGAVQPRAGAAQARPKIEALFEKMVFQRCSDLHLSVGSPPLFRKDGEITPLGETRPLTAEQIRDMLLEITPGPNCTEFEEQRDTDFSYELSETARFRANLFMDRRGMGAVFRYIPGKIPTAQELGLSKHVLEMCQLHKGLVLVTGPTGSGKSTTLAAMIDYINTNRSAHIITVEDPIEFVHANKRCLVNQREVGRHTESFEQALRAALREDPDILLVGEMRDLETVAIALETAETGHLVFGTLHTNTAASAVDRIIDQFPADRQAQVRTMLAETLRGVVAQILVRRRGGGLLAAQEVLIVNSAVSNLIREGKTFQIQSIIQTGRAQGMVTMNDALMDLVRAGLVEPDAAFAKAPGRAEFKALLDRNNIRLPAGRDVPAGV